MQKSPEKSTHKAMAELKISRSLLHSDLYLYKVRVVHEFITHDKQQRLEFALWVEHKETKLHNVWFADEAHFHLYGVVNKQNAQFWTPRYPCIFTEKMHHTPQTTVWAAVSSQTLMELAFFNQTVNSECFLSKLHDSSVSQLTETVVHAR
jgi:hypothetical protein